MYFYTRAFRDDEIELLRGGEIADARVGHIRRLVSRHHVVPYTHFFFFCSLRLSIRSNCLFFLFLWILFPSPYLALLLALSLCK